MCPINIGMISWDLADIDDDRIGLDSSVVSSSIPGVQLVSTVDCTLTDWDGSGAVLTGPYL